MLSTSSTYFRLRLESPMYLAETSIDDSSRPSLNLQLTFQMIHYLCHVIVECSTCQQDKKFTLEWHSLFQISFEDILEKIQSVALPKRLKTGCQIEFLFLTSQRLLVILVFESKDKTRTTKTLLSTRNSSLLLPLSITHLVRYIVGNHNG